MSVGARTTELGQLLVSLQLSDSAFLAIQIFWYFVVGLWPVLYWRVYL